MLVIVARSSKGNSKDQLGEEKEFGIAERMLICKKIQSITMNLGTTSQRCIPLYQNDIVSPTVESSTIKSSQSFEDLLAMDSKVLTNPPKQIWE